MKNLKNLIKRTLTGIIFVGLLIFGIVFSPYSFAVLFLLITVLSLWEFYNLVKVEAILPIKIFGVIIGGLFFLCSFAYAYELIDKKYFYLFILAFLIIPIIELYRKNRHPFTNISYTILGLVYVVVPFSLLNYIVLEAATCGVNFCPNILLGIFFIQWASDTGAYLTGMSIGKTRLFERISPKKSWEGSIGGAIIALGVSWVISLYFNDLQLIEWLVVALLIIVSGTYGDLVESLLKRSINIKDSGTILPGHGGMLDRFDSMLFAAPAVFVYLKFFVEN